MQYNFHLNIYSYKKLSLYFCTTVYKSLRALYFTLTPQICLYFLRLRGWITDNGATINLRFAGVDIIIFGERRRKVSFPEASRQDVDQIYIFKGASYADTHDGKRWIRRRRYRCIREPWCRCEKKIAYIRILRCHASVEAPLACLRYGRRAPLSDVLCRTIWIVLYETVPRTAGVRGQREKKIREKIRVKVLL